MKMKPLTSLSILIAASIAGAQTAKQNNIQASGYLDIYYTHNLAHADRGPTINGRSLDTRNHQLDLSFAELDFTQATSARGFGFTAMFYGGTGPDIIHLTEPGGKNKYKWIRQAFATYQTSGKNPITFDLGKFDTWIGYESLDNRDTDEYSRSFNTTYSEPSYDMGFRASSQLSDKLTGTLYLVQGWNEVEDSNKGKTWGIALSYAPDANTTYLLQNHSGTEGSTRPNDIGAYGGIGFGQPGASHVDVINFQVCRQATPKTKMALSADYANSSDAPNKGQWNGQAIYFQYQISPIKSASLRFDRFEDRDGIRTGAPVKLFSITGAYDHAFTPNFSLRAELRHDISDHTFFSTHSGVEKTQTTLTLAGIAKF
jgi:hypothetical protein